MTTQIKLLAEAEADLADAALWYEGRVPGLAAEFLRCVEEALGRVARHPLAYRPIDGGYRRALVRRFPFAVVFRLVEETAVVVAIHHTQRQPEFWRHRH